MNSEVEHFSNHGDHFTFAEAKRKIEVLKSDGSAYSTKHWKFQLEDTGKTNRKGETLYDVVAIRIERARDDGFER